MVAVLPVFLFLPTCAVYGVWCGNVRRLTTRELKCERNLIRIEIQGRWAAEFIDFPSLRRKDSVDLHLRHRFCGSMSLHCEFKSRHSRAKPEFAVMRRILPLRELMGLGGGEGWLVISSLKVNYFLAG